MFRISNESSSRFSIESVDTDVLSDETKPIAQKFVAWKQESTKILQDVRTQAPLSDLDALSMSSFMKDEYDPAITLNISLPSEGKYPLLTNPVQISDSEARFALALSFFLDGTRYTLDFLRYTLEGKTFDSNIPPYRRNRYKVLRAGQAIAKAMLLPFKGNATAMIRTLAVEPVLMPKYLPNIMDDLPAFLDEVIGSYKVDIQR